MTVGSLYRVEDSFRHYQVRQAIVLNNMETQNQDKIRENVADAVNQKIDHSTEENLRHYNQMGPTQIADRIRQTRSGMGC